jgi:hypothetical protein
VNTLTSATTVSGVKTWVGTESVPDAVINEPAMTVSRSFALRHVCRGVVDERLECDGT